MADILNEKTLLSVATIGKDIQSRIINLLNAINDGITAEEMGATSSIDAFKNDDKLMAATALKQILNIGGFAFHNCSILTEITFDNALRVDVSAFAGCTNLSTVGLPVASQIKSFAFDGCTSLTALYLGYSGVVSLGTSAFRSTPFASGLGLIFVNASYLSDYLSASEWSAYSSILIAF